MKLEYVVTNSELNAFKTCRRTWFYTYCHGRLMPKGDAMALGLECHEHLEKLLEEGISPSTETKAGKIIKAFMGHLGEASDDDELISLIGDQSLEVEKEVFLKLSEQAGIRGKLDVYFPKTNTILDWKTGGALWEDEHVWRSDQFRTYSCAIRQLYGEAPVVKVQSIRSVDPGHSSSKPPYYSWVGLPQDLSPDGKFPDRLLDIHQERLTEEVEELLRNKQLAADGVRVDRPTFSRACNWCPVRKACDKAKYNSQEEWTRLAMATTAGDPNARYL